MNLHQLADELLEIRRYVRDQPEMVEGRLQELCSPLWPVPDADHDLRLCENIEVGRNCILHDPEVLRGYLYGAAPWRCERRPASDRRREEETRGRR